MPKSRLAFSHLGIFVYDLDRMAAFYQRVLGLVQTDRGFLPGRELAFLSGDPTEHHQVVLATGRTGSLDDKVINQISFRIETLEELQSTYAQLKEEPDVTDFRPLDHGNAWTLYFRDPELNRIEVFADSPWYASQPVAEPLDLDLPADEIRRRTEVLCRADPHFASVEDWRSATAEKIARANAG